MDWSDGSPEVSGWALGGSVFAAVLMMVAGSFQVIAGITAGRRA